MPDMVAPIAMYTAYAIQFPRWLSLIVLIAPSIVALVALIIVLRANR